MLYMLVGLSPPCDVIHGCSILLSLFSNLGRNALSYLPENLFQYMPNLLYLYVNFPKFPINAPLMQVAKCEQFGSHRK